MKIPTSIRINGVDFAVIFEERLNNGMNLAYGHVDFVHARIRLDPQNQGHQYMCITLWHEILHTIIFNAQLDLPDEEQTVRALSAGIYQVLQDNGRQLFDLIPIEEDTKDEP